MQCTEKKGQRLGDVAEGTEMVLRGLEVLLRIRRLWRSFRGAPGSSASPSLSDLSYALNAQLVGQMHTFLS